MPGRRAVLHLAAALSFLLSSSTPQAVLCVAGDHHSIEVIAGMSCHPSSQFSGGLAVAGLDDGCPRDCTDTPLSGQPALRGGGGSDLANLAFSPLAALFTDQPSLQFARELFAGLRVDPPPLAPRVLRPTVLRC